MFQPFFKALALGLRFPIPEIVQVQLGWHGRATDQHGIARSFQVGPVIEDPPLCREVRAVALRKAVTTETQMQMDEGFQQGIVLPLTKELLQLWSVLHEFLGHLPIRIASDQDTRRIQND